MSLGIVATALLLPPVNLIPIALGGMVLARFRPRLGRFICGGALLLVLLFAMPVVSLFLLRTLEAGLPRNLPQAALQRPELTDQEPVGSLPGAIIILSADGTYGSAGGILPQPGLGMMTLERIQAGAVLARRVSLPVLVTGGQLSSNQPPIAAMMARAMQQDFGITPSWIETNSTDTWQNAEYSAKLLTASGVRSAYVVTTAWHMRRTLIAFRHFGFEAVPVPSRFTGTPRFEFEDFVPRASSLMNSYFAIHEWIGCAWYAIGS